MPFMKKMLYFVLAVIAFMFTFPLFWERNIIAGAGFVLAVLYALYNGSLIRNPHVMGYIILGTIITYIATIYFVPKALDNYKTSNFVGLFVVMIVFGLIWFAGYRLKKRRR